MSKKNPSDDHLADEVLSKILNDEQKSVAEKRSDYRELLFVPAQISQPKFEFTVSGFTRDVSTQGVCLIMPQPFRLGVEAQIELFGITSQGSSDAKCCWNAKFGDAYWVSGWQLEQGVPVGKLLKEDRAIEPDQRDSDRLKAAVPVSIHLPGKSSRIAGFSRNLSQDGLCLISKAEVQPNQIADLEVMRLNGESSRIESCCRWVTRYGEDHWMSGWKFKKVCG